MIINNYFLALKKIAFCKKIIVKLKTKMYENLYQNIKTIKNVQIL